MRTVEIKVDKILNQIEKKRKANLQFLQRA